MSRSRKVVSSEWGRIGRRQDDARSSRAGGRRGKRGISQTTNDCAGAYERCGGLIAVATIRKSCIVGGVPRLPALPPARDDLARRERVTCAAPSIGRARGCSALYHARAVTDDHDVSAQ